MRHDHAIGGPSLPSNTRNYQLAYPLSVGRILAGAPAKKGSIPNEKALVQTYLYGTPGNDSWNQFLNTEFIAFDFIPSLQLPSLLINGYFDRKGGSQASEFRADLLQLSLAIQQREQATAGLVPQYTLLDPQFLPYFLYI